MINIFDSKKTKIRNSKSRKRVTKKKREKANEELGKKNLSKLSPMAYPVLALHYKKKNPSEWIVKSFVTINSSPHALTDRWIKSINTWVSQVCESMSLDEPDIAVGARSDIGPIEIIKIKDPNMMSEYPTPSIIAKDKRGWKWFFKTSKAYNYSAGDLITLKATVSSHGEGITFLKRPSKILKLDKNNLFGEK